jgi:N-acetylneuraminate synthase/sialic acid synthase
VCSSQFAKFEQDQTMERKIKLNGMTVSDDSDCYIIAEIGNNHQGELDKAKEMFRVAKECGVNAVKLQKRDNQSLYTKALYDKPYDNPNSFGLTYGEHREYLEFGKAEYLELLDYAKELGIDMFATAFDIPSTDFLEDVGVPIYKIASGDLTSIPLLEHVARKNKPIILSTGGGSMDDIQRAYDTIMPINNRLCLLQCTAAYPAEAHDLNLKVISELRERFPELVIGLSDHENGIAMAVAAYVLGARVLEKHFTLNHTWKGTDHAFSLAPIGLRKLVRDIRRLPFALGNGVKQAIELEKEPIRKMSKAIYASSNLTSGHVLKREDLAFKCPGDGIPLYYIDKVVGMKLLRDITEDDAILFDMLSE